MLCSLGFSAVYILLCCWACLPFCLASCLDSHLSINPRPTVPGPQHFSGYSSVPDGKVSWLGNMWGAGPAEATRVPPNSLGIVREMGSCQTSLDPGLGSSAHKLTCHFTSLSLKF